MDDGEYTQYANCDCLNGRFVYVGCSKAFARVVMINFLKKHPIKLILLALLLVFVVTPASLNYSGFCMVQGRWLSDEEKIKLAVQAVNNRGPNRSYFKDKDADKYGNNDAFKYNKYLDYDDFLKRNPN